MHKPSIRKVLADSCVGAVAVAGLLVGSVDYVLQASAIPLSRLITFFVTAAAILDIPYFYRSEADHLMWMSSLMILHFAALSLALAWLLSQWIYGAGPIRSLTECRERFMRRQHA